MNGNGTIDSSEKILATLTGTNTYKANFPALPGPAGNRTITVSAGDPTGNTATVTSSVHVQAPNPARELERRAGATTFVSRARLSPRWPAT